MPLRRSCVGPQGNVPDNQKLKYAVPSIMSVCRDSTGLLSPTARHAWSELAYDAQTSSLIAWRNVRIDIAPKGWNPAGGHCFSVRHTPKLPVAFASVSWSSTSFKACSSFATRSSATDSLVACGMDRARGTTRYEISCVLFLRVTSISRGPARQYSHHCLAKRSLQAVHVSRQTSGGSAVRNLSHGRKTSAVLDGKGADAVALCA